MRAINRKGQGVPGVVVTVIVAVTMLAVGGIIVNELFTSFDTDMAGSDMEAGWNKTKSATTTTFNLLPIVLILLGASALIAAVYIFARRTG